MASDASIYSMIRPPQPVAGPMDQFGKALQIKHLMDSGQLNELQRRKLESDMAEEDAYKQVFRNAPDPTSLSVHDLYRASPTRAVAYEKNRLEVKEKQGNIDKTAQELEASRAKYLRDSLASVTDQPSYDAWLADAKAKGAKVAGAAPTVFDPAWQQKHVMDADKFITSIKPDYKPVSAGGTTVMRQMNPQAPGFSAEPVPHTATPGEVMTDARAKAANAETARHHGVIEGQDKFGPPQEVTGPDGKPRLIMQNKKDGSIVDANTRLPIPGVGPKVGEQAQKQQVGVQNTMAALTEYKDALKGFSLADIANPNARAKMGTVYNNALLQAKEAFNLGVLNGPDYMILQEVLTNPTSLKGGITSKEALNSQATKLEEIMGRIGQQVTATQSGVTPATPPAAPTRSQIDAELRRRGVIK